MDIILTYAVGNNETKSKEFTNVEAPGLTNQGFMTFQKVGGPLEFMVHIGRIVSLEFSNNLVQVVDAIPSTPGANVVKGQFGGVA